MQSDEFDEEEVPFEEDMPVEKDLDSDETEEHRPDIKQREILDNLKFAGVSIIEEIESTETSEKQD